MRGVEEEAREIGRNRREKYGHYFGERNIGERAKVIREF